MANFTTGCYNSAMSKYLRDFFISTFAILIVLAGIIFAGTISNEEAPDASGTMYTLEDIYQKMTDPDYTDLPTHDLYPAVSTAENPMSTLDEIYGAIPDFQTIDGSTTTLSAGLYATTNLTEIEDDLVGENIAAGTTIFNVEGTFDCTAP